MASVLNTIGNKCRDAEAKAHYESGRALCELVGQRVGRAAPHLVGPHGGLGVVLHLVRLRGGVELVVVGLERAVARRVAAGYIFIELYINRPTARRSQV